MAQIAVLIAAYNATSTLPECLDSLCSQTLADIELLCVDDCSTDETFSLLQNRAAKDPRIKVFQTPVNSGQAVARNLALEHVTAPLVCMVDADDWLSPDALQSAVDVFRNHPSTDSVVFRLCRVFEEDGQRREEEWPMPEELSHSPFGNKHLDEKAYISGEKAFEFCMDGWKLHGLYAVRTPLHRQIPFDTTARLYSDDNTSRLHYLHSREVRACNGIYFYRQHPTSMTTSFNIRRFDFMEANLSLRAALLKENVSTAILRSYEGHRWLTFIACYRLYLTHRHELNSPTLTTSSDILTSLRTRFSTIFGTFRLSRLPLRYHWKPGYWFLPTLTLFDLQQRLYIRIKNKR